MIKLTKHQQFCFDTFVEGINYNYRNPTEMFSTQMDRGTENGGTVYISWNRLMDLIAQLIVDLGNDNMVFEDIQDIFNRVHKKQIENDIEGKKKISQVKELLSK